MQTNAVNKGSSVKIKSPKGPQRHLKDSEGSLSKLKNFEGLLGGQCIIIVLKTFWLKTFKTILFTAAFNIASSDEVNFTTMPH